MTDTGGSAVAASGSAASSLDHNTIGIERMVAGHAELRDLCRQLEGCADLLPDRHAIPRAALVSAALAATLRRHDASDLATLPALLGIDSAAIGTLPRRIEGCHAIDQLHAEDLHDALATAAVGAPIHAETLSYMMRSVFEGCRRGICFQEAAILLLVGARITSSARAMLWSSLTGGATAA